MSGNTIVFDDNHDKKQYL